MLVLRNSGALLIDPRRRRVPVTKRILRLDDAPHGLAHPAGKGVPLLMEVDISNACPLGVHFDSFGKGVSGQLIATMQPSPVERGPQAQVGRFPTQNRLPRKCHRL
jgi:hypothetical protein